MLLYNVLKKDKGFTLIEVITVVIIVGVLAAIAAPNFLGLLNRTRVKDGLNLVEGAIKESQRLAIRRGKTCKIRFTSTGTGNNSAIVEVTPDETIGGTTVSYTGCLLSSRELPDDVSFELFDSGSGSLVPVNSTNTIDLTFTGKGNTVSTNEGIMVIKHANVNAQKCIQIEGLLGNILTGDFDSGTDTCKVQ